MFDMHKNSIQHTILGERIVSRDGLPRGVLPSGILKIEKYCPGLKVRSPKICSRVIIEIWQMFLSGIYLTIIITPTNMEQIAVCEIDINCYV